MQQQKIAVITGGSRGLGKDMALKLAEKGLNIVLTYHSNRSAAEKVVAEVNALGQVAFALPLDVTDIKQYKPFFEEKLSEVLSREFNTKTFDFLINNAGTGIHAPFTDTSVENFHAMANVHLMPAFFLTQAAVGYMNDGGGIVNISTGLTRFTLPGYAAYAAVKGAVEVLSNYQAKELGHRQIRVNTVAPGAIETDFGGGVVRDNKGLNEQIAGTTALGRVGLPEDIGPVVAFLCSEEARWVNGQRIEVSGGVHL